MMPIMSPLDTMPTTRPRVASGARWAASGIRICTATEPRPITAAQARKTAAEGAKAAKASATALERRRYQDEPAVLDEIAERHDEQETEAIADLRHGHDEARRSRGKAKRLRDLRDQGLRVIDIGDKEAAGNGKRQDRAGRHIRRPGASRNIGAGVGSASASLIFTRSTDSPHSRTRAPSPEGLALPTAFAGGTPAISVIRLARPRHAKSRMLVRSSRRARAASARPAWRSSRRLGRETPLVLAARPQALGVFGFDFRPGQALPDAEAELLQDRRRAGSVRAQGPSRRARCPSSRALARAAKRRKRPPHPAARSRAPRALRSVPPTDRACSRPRALRGMSSCPCRRFSAL